MTIETLYATSHITGDITNPGNALGNTPTTWAGTTNVVTSATSRYAIDNPVNGLTAGYTTHTIAVVVRKGTNTGNPTVVVTLFENGVSVKTLVASTTITSSTGQTLSGTFTSAEISNVNNLEVQVAITAVGGSSAVRNSAQVSHFTASIDTTAQTAPGAPTSVTASTAGYNEASVSWTAPASDGGSAITGYALRSSTNSGESWTSHGTASGVSRLLTGLSAVSHVFQVAAVNVIGQGDWSTSSNAITPTVDPWTTFSDGVSATTGATVTGLTNGTAYEFRVAAINAEGQGTWSNIAGPYTPAIGDPTAQTIKIKMGGVFSTVPLKVKVSGVFT